MLTVGEKKEEKKKEKKKEKHYTSDNRTKINGVNNGEHMFVLSVCVCMSVQVDNAKKDFFLGVTAAKHLNPLQQWMLLIA